MKNILRCHTNDWFEVLPIALLAMRISPISANDVSPFPMVTGSTMVLPSAMVQKPNLISDQEGFVKTLAKHMSELTFAQPKWHQSSKQSHYVPNEMATCDKVWVRVDRTRKPLEAPYSGPFKVVKRNDKFFTIELPSGKTDTVSLNRLKPFVQNCLQKHDYRNPSEIKIPKLIVQPQEDDAEIQIDSEPDDDLPEQDSSTSDDNDNSDNGDNNVKSNHEKFAQRIPYQSRYGRTIRFAEKNDVKLIPRYGRSLPLARK